jgi:hypothetical protein
VRRTLGLASRFTPVILLVSLAFAHPATGETRSGRTRASATSMVTLTLPSVHGVNVPSLPVPTASPIPVVLASRSTRGSVETLPLQLISTNASSELHMVRTLRRSADRPFALAASGGASPAEAAENLDVRSSSRTGAIGWTLLKDRIELSSAARVSSGPERKTTVIYEIWDF